MSPHRFLACATGVLLGGVSTQAAVVAVPGGFEVSYSATLSGTLHGSDITSIYVLESDGNQVNVDSGFTLPGQGPFTLTHVVPFAPTSSLVVGLDLAPEGSGLVDHLVVFMDNDFAAAALELPKFSDIFPAVGDRPRLGHNALVQALKDADLGDPAALGVLTDFFTKDAGQFAAFDPGSSFRVVEFSVPVPIDVPDSGTTLAMMALAAFSALGLRRKLRRGRP